MSSRYPHLDHNLEGVTIGELYEPAMTIYTQEEATAYFYALVDRRIRKYALGMRDPEEMERINLAYYAGYHDHETRKRVEKFFKCEHPLLGKAGDKPMDPEEAFKLGAAWSAKQVGKIQHPDVPAMTFGRVLDI